MRSDATLDATLNAASRILVAEDSATQAQQLQYTLERHGYQVTCAANGRLALEAAQRNKPALIISDVIMPEMNGYELCRRVKTDARMTDIPVILVTTLSDPHDVIRGLECGADNFILKPYDSDQLLRRIQFVLVNSQMRCSEQSDMGLEIVFSGQKHFITADRLQILNLLLSTYEAAIDRNKELSSTRDALRTTNAELQHLTRELEDRVLMRTRELERTNEALRQAQRALIQQERLRALGQMASGIAHDINNAISPISLYTESLLEREPNLSAGARDRLVTIQRAIDDVAQTVARMREFYRPRELELQVTDVDLNALVQQVVDLTRARWSDQPQQRGVVIQLQSELADDLPDIMGSEVEIRDALTNLIFNAVDAMPDGGTLSVRTRAISSGDAGNGEAQRQVIVEVTDTGVGMDEETRRRCLEPFYTTKGERGTGLGLAMVYGMIQRHSAELEIDSAVRAGTTVRLSFAAADSPALTTGEGPRPQPALRRLRILLVDDDPTLIKSLRDILEQDGHVVTVADGGQSGIEAFNSALARGAPFALVITDLGMPYVDGRRVAAAVKATAQTPVILLTGWGRRLLADHEIPDNVDRVLSKPPRLHEVRTAIAELTATTDPNAARSA
jgi:DNA-binding response OmpR family regulator/anti-sigma regulatory factor (Ser/Thr protein kinase)